MKAFWVVLAILGAATAARAEEVVATAGPERDRPTAIELNAVWPFVPGVGILQARVTTRLWESGGLRGDLVLSVMGRPTQDREDEGEFSELGGGVGYRQYLAGGAHLEVAAYPTWARLANNVVDGQTYEAFALTVEAYAGYRFALSELGVEAARSWAVEPVATLQVGVGSNVLNTNPWPVRGEDGGVFFVGSLLVGVAF